MRCTSYTYTLEKVKLFTGRKSRRQKVNTENGLPKAALCPFKGRSSLQQNNKNSRTTLLFAQMSDFFATITFARFSFRSLAATIYVLQAGVTISPTDRFSAYDALTVLNDDKTLFNSIRRLSLKLRLSFPPARPTAPSRCQAK